MNRKVVKLAAFGAIMAVAVDYFLKPSVAKSLGMR